MKSSTTRASIAILSLMAGSIAFAGPDHKHHSHDDKVKAAEESLTLEQLVGKVEAPDLFIGSSAPDLQIAKFVKGDSFDQFDKDQVYVVEFWATWCGPCIAAFPHLSSLQADYGEKVKFIGVNVWERDKDQGERIERITDFVADQGDKMSYSVAVETDSAMSESWLRPANQNGIPAAFIVDGSGRVAWIGHPMTMDTVLEEIVEGDFDMKASRKEALESLKMNKAFTIFGQAMQTGENLDKARLVAQALINDHLGDDPQGLNQIAWTLLSAESDKIGMADYKLAYKAAKKACEASEWSSWMILDTYALAAHKTGNNAEAIKWQTKAIEMIPAEYERARPELEEALAKYKKAQG